MREGESSRKEGTGSVNNRMRREPMEINTHSIKRKQYFSLFSASGVACYSSELSTHWAELVGFSLSHNKDF